MSPITLVGPHVAPEFAAALKTIAQDADEVLAMLKRANVLVASAALAIPHDETRAHAVQFVKESTALVRRIEGKR